MNNANDNPSIDMSTGRVNHSPQYQEGFAQAIRATASRSDDAWSTAFGISAGSGCTPFYATARSLEDSLVGLLKDFQERFGKEAVERLNIRKRNGWNYE